MKKVLLAVFMAMASIAAIADENEKWVTVYDVKFMINPTGGRSGQEVSVQLTDFAKQYMRDNNFKSLVVMVEPKNNILSFFIDLRSPKKLELTAERSFGSVYFECGGNKRFSCTSSDFRAWINWTASHF